MHITSLQNDTIKHLVRLRDNKKHRLSEGKMLVEGIDEIQLALDAGHIPLMLLSAPELASRQLILNPPEFITISPPVFQKLSYRENPDGWIAVFPIPQKQLSAIELSNAPLVIVCESIEKPGNLGAILRTADAADVDALLVCDPRVDLWNPNVVRASRGAAFSVPVVECDNAAGLEWLKDRQIGLVAATPSAQSIYTEVNLKQPTAIVVGTEDNGLSEFWLENADEQVQIPMMGKVNSLNVSVSTALIIYEALRQRGSQ